jgi:hypothetical protein
MTNFKRNKNEKMFDLFADQMIKAVPIHGIRALYDGNRIWLVKVKAE